MNSERTLAARSKWIIVCLGTWPNCRCKRLTAILTLAGSFRHWRLRSASSCGSPGISTSSMRVSSEMSSTGLAWALSSESHKASKGSPSPWTSSSISPAKATPICRSSSFSLARFPIQSANFHDRKSWVHCTSLHVNAKPWSLMNGACG